jgi:serine/threonine protein kinase
MGAVYEARNPLDLPVALKVIRVDRGGEMFLARFRQEARAMQQLKHPNILRIFHYDVVEGSPYFTMELIRGGNLAEVLGDYREKPVKCVDLMLKIVDAVAYLHEQGMLHRDLKPQNILVDEHGEPFLTDFGLVKEFDPEENLPESSEIVLRENKEPPSTVNEIAQVETRLAPRVRAGLDQSLTYTGAQMGTRPYMSPEQIDGRKDAFGPATDVWALGVILYELLTQHRPFEGPSITTLEESIRNAEPLPPLEINESKHVELNRIVARCLAKQPQERFANARELQRELAEWQTKLLRRPFATRPRIIAAVVASVALLTLVVFLAFSSSDPQQEVPISINTLEEIQQEHREGKRLVLAGESKPRWFESLGLPGNWLDAEKGSIGYESERTSMIELARGLGKPAYRFTVRLQPEVRKGDIGVYVGRKSFDNGKSVRHVYLLALLASQPESQTLTLQVTGTRFDERIETTKLPKLPGPDPKTNAITPDINGEYLFSFEVQPDSIAFFANGQLFHKISRIELMAKVKDFARIRKEWGDVTPTFDLPDGLGLFLRDGARVRIKEILLEGIK